MKKFALFLLTVFIIPIIIAGCKSSISGGVTADIPVENNLEPIALFCQKDSCSKNLEFLLNSAKESINCAFYDLNLKNIIDVLERKSSEADVKIVIDNENYDKQVRGNVKIDNNNQLMHNKFCIIDNKAVWSGSFNPTENDNEINDNNAVVFYSSLLAENYENEFNELWNENFGSGSRVKNPIIYLNNKKIENYFCPEDDCELHLIEQIRNAKKSVYFMTFSFTSEAIADEILFRDNIGIKGVFESRGMSQFSEYERLKGFGLDVKKDKNKGNMHHKVFIIDNETVATGSYNPTESGNSRNDENLLIIHDKEIASAYLEEFQRIFNQ